MARLLGGAGRSHKSATAAGSEGGITIIPDEASMLSRCRHPLIVTLYTWDVSGVLVVERGLTDVATWLSACRAQWRSDDAVLAASCERAELILRLYLCTTACIGVAHMHSCGVMHRDLKTNNVVVTTAGGIDGCGGLQAIVSAHGRRHPTIAQFTCKIIDLSRARSVPVDVSASAVGVPALAVRAHRAGVEYRADLAPELYEPAQPFHCCATDVHALVHRVLHPMLRHPLTRVSMLSTAMTSAPAHASALGVLVAGLDAALSHSHAARPSASDLVGMLVAALSEAAEHDVAASM
jgi:serine/threonine protein kinase